MNLKWSSVSRYRNELFGLSIISIMVFHYFEGVAGADYAGRALKLTAAAFNGAIGSVGVDIFLFLSGFGIWYSLNKRSGIKDFYVKRVRRVLIPYTVMGGLFWIVKDILIGRASIGRFFYDFSLLSFWGSGVRTFWYISFICILYFFSPAVYQKGRKACLAVSVGAVLLSIVLYFVNRAVFTNIEVAVLRVPAYMAGMYCAELADKDLPVSGKSIALLFLSLPVKLIAGLTDFPFSRLINAGYGLLFVIVYLLIRDRFRDGRLSGFLVRAGALSLELYIVHVAVRNLMGTAGLRTANPLIYGVCIIISVPAAMFFAGLQGFFQNRNR